MFSSWQSHFLTSAHMVHTLLFIFKPTRNSKIFENLLRGHLNYAQRFATTNYSLVQHSRAEWSGRAELVITCGVGQCAEESHASGFTLSSVTASMINSRKYPQ